MRLVTVQNREIPFAAGNQETLHTNRTFAQKAYLSASDSLTAVPWEDALQITATNGPLDGTTGTLKLRAKVGSTTPNGARAETAKNAEKNSGRITAEEPAQASAEMEKSTVRATMVKNLEIPFAVGKRERLDTKRTFAQQKNRTATVSFKEPQWEPAL